MLRRLIFSMPVVALLICATAAIAVEGDVYRTVVGAKVLHQHGIDGDGVTVAIIDSGVANVPELQGSLITQINMSGAPDSGDQFGHGTFVAGLVHRVAPKAKLLSVKLSGADGSVDVTQIIAALEWVVIHKDTYDIDVVNLSFGNDSKQSYMLSPLSYAVEQAWDAGITVVVSSGNLGSESNTVTKPGDDPLVITVGSTDDQMSSNFNDDTIPDFVSRGPTQDGLTKPDVVAPGSHLVSLRAPGSTIDSQFPEGRVSTTEFKGSGTSFSTAIVSGAVALILEEHPLATPDEIKQRLMETARPIDGDQTAVGAGSIDTDNAIEYSGALANRNVARSNGSGTLEADRGSVHVTIPGLLGLPLAVNGELTAQGNLLVRAGLLDALWSSLTWQDTQWAASRWGATEWDASRWGASRWGASRWGASEYWASRWG